jgi:hypothetical protein
MKATLTNINASIILQALRKSNPVTAVGRAAVENYRAYLANNSMTAIALENSIISLTTTQYDAGLESLVATLKGMMPESKRRVAVTYELIANEAKTLFSVGEPALEALNDLYDLDAMKIIDSINSGALDSFKMNPNIAKLINWAKAAYKSAPERAMAQGTGDVKVTLTPILNIATTPEGDSLVAIDGKAFLIGKRGKATFIPNLGDIENIPNEVRAIVAELRNMKVSSSEPNVLVFNDDIIDYVRKALAIDSFGIDLLGDSDTLIRINGNAMSAEKAKTLLQQSESEMIANLILNDTAKDALSMIANSMNLFDRYRGTIYSNKYASKFDFGNVIVYILNQDDSVTVLTVTGGTVTDASAYDNMFSALSNDIFIANPALHNAVSVAFANDLKEDAKKLSVRQNLAAKLIDERKQYENLLERIKREIDDMADVVDANPDKVKALNELKTKTEEQIATTSEEINKLVKA